MSGRGGNVSMGQRTKDAMPPVSDRGTLTQHVHTALVEHQQELRRRLQEDKQSKQANLLQIRFLERSIEACELLQKAVNKNAFLNHSQKDYAWFCLRDVVKATLSQKDLDFKDVLLLAGYLNTCRG